MNKFKFDKIQIVGILFLLITLFLGIFVAINKGFSFNINEKAGIDGGMDTLTGATEGRNYGTINDQQNGENVSTNAAPTVFVGKSDCGGKCKTDQICSVYINKNVVTDKQLYYCKQRPIPVTTPALTGTQTTVVPPAAATVIPIVRPTLTPALRTATGGYDFQTAKNDLAAPNTAGFDFKNGEISGYYRGDDGLYYAIGGTGNNPDNYIEERLRDLQIANSTVSQEARIYKYEQTIVNAAAKEAEAAREVMLQKMEDAKSAAITTNMLAYNQPIDSLEQTRLDRVNAQSQQAKQEYINAGLLALSNATNQQFQSDENANLNESITKCGSSDWKWENNTCLPRDQDYIQKTEQLITEGKVTRDANWSASLPEYASCQNETDPAQKLACNTLKNGIEGTIYDYVPKAENYITNWQNINAATFSDNQYGFTNYVNSFNAGIRNKDTVLSTIDLGVDLTKKAAIVAAPFQLGATEGMTTVAGVFKVISGVSAVDQAGRATTTCITDPLSTDCGKEVAYTLLSVLNLDVNDALIAGRAGSAAYNTIVTGGNLIADAFQIKDGCKGANSSTSNCLMAFGSISADIFFAGADFRQGELLRLNKPADFEVKITRIPEQTPQLSSGQTPNIIDLVPDTNNPDLYVDPLAVRELTATNNTSGNDMLFSPRDVQTDLNDALATNDNRWINNSINGVMDDAIPTKSITQRARESITGLYQEFINLVDDIRSGPFRNSEDLANLDVLAPRINEPDLPKTDLLEPDIPVVKVDVPEADTPIVKVDPVKPEPVKTAADAELEQNTLARAWTDNVVRPANAVAETGARVWDNAVRTWNEYVPVQRWIDDFTANPRPESLSPSVVDPVRIVSERINLDENPKVKVKIGDTIIIGNKRVTLVEGMGLGSNYDKVIKITKAETEIDLKENRLVFFEKDTSASTPRDMWQHQGNITQPASKTEVQEPFIITLESKTNDTIPTTITLNWTKFDDFIFGSASQVKTKVKPMSIAEFIRTANIVGTAIPVTTATITVADLVVETFGDIFNQNWDLMPTFSLTDYIQNRMEKINNTQSSMKNARDIEVKNIESNVQPPIPADRDDPIMPQQDVTSGVTTSDDILTSTSLFNDAAIYTQYSSNSFRNAVYHVIQVDMSNVEFFVNPPTKKTTTTSFLEYNNLDIAINGDGWETYVDEQGITRVRTGGYAMSNGIAYSDYGKDEQTIYFDKNNNILFEKPTDPNDIYNAISYPNRLINKGEIVSHPDKVDLNPRTALGVREDGTLILVTVDGKEYQSGVTVDELAQILKSQGAVDAVMFDSGTSSTMVARDENGIPFTVNNPDSSNPSGENQVNNHLGIRFK